MRHILLALVGLSVVGCGSTPSSDRNEPSGSTSTPAKAQLPPISELSACQTSEECGGGTAFCGYAGEGAERDASHCFKDWDTACAYQTCPSGSTCFSFESSPLRVVCGSDSPSQQ